MVLVAIAVLLLTAILALTLDGGTIYLDRRQIQNAADAGALAGAEGLMAVPTNYTTVHQQALSTVVRNLPGTSVPSGFAPPPNQTTVGSPPLSIGANYTVQLVVTTTYTYQVTIWHVRPVAIAPIHGFASTITLQVQATAQNANLPYGVVVLQDTTQQYPDLAIKAGTTASLTLSGGGGAADRGGIASNASIEPNTGTITFSPCSGAGDLWAFSESAADAAQVATQVTCQQTPGSPQPRVLGPKLSIPLYPEPVPPSFVASTGATVATGQTVYLCPGQYGSQINVAGTAVLLPGVFQVQAGGVSVSGTLRTLQASDFAGGPIAGSSTNCGQPVASMPADPGVIVEITPGIITGTSNCSKNQFSTSGSGSSVTLVSSPKYFNISLYVETMTNWQNCLSPGGTMVVNVTGGGYYNIGGAIYGPYDNMQLAGGTAGSSLRQLVAWTLTVTGGSVAVTYDPNRVPYVKGLVQ